MKSFKSSFLFGSVMFLFCLSGCSVPPQSDDGQASVVATEKVAQESMANSATAVGLSPTSLKNMPKLILKYKVGEGRARAFHAKKIRSTKPVSFTNKIMSLIVAPDGSVSLKRIDKGEVVSNAKSKSWSVYKWTDGHIQQRKPGTQTALNNMAQVGPNELMLWSSDAPFLVHLAILAKDRHFKFELLHVSNDAKTGGLNNDWPGHRVEFDVRIDSQADGWMLNTLLLNPYSEINSRAPFSISNGFAFKWPYPQWSQTDDRPQPQGLVGVFGFASDEEFDDILSDIWVSEPSLPRPNRANLKSWTRADVDAWLDNWIEKLGQPWRMFSFSHNGNSENLYRIVEVAQKAGVNRIKLHNRGGWQGDSPGSFDKSVFKNGAADARKWADYCNEHGVDVHLHGFGQVIQYDDPKYGRFVLHDGLARSAQGTLLNDVALGETVLLVEPDLTFWPGMQLGMLPYYGKPPWGSSNGGYGTAFPPYYESNAGSLKIGKSLYSYGVKLTPDNRWEVTLGKKRVGPETSVLKKGSLVEFMVMGTAGWFLPDSRSELLEQISKEYADALNAIRGNPHYDGSGWTGDIGSWGLRKFTQMVYEQLDHPVDTGTGSAFGLHLFGDFEHQFRKISRLKGQGRRGTMPVTTFGNAALASSLYDANHGLNKGVQAKDATVRGNHRGISLHDTEAHGGWEEMMEAFTIWSKVKPYLTEEQKKKIHNYEDVYLATQTADQWHIKRARAMRRDGIDAAWQHVPERPDVAPRQFLKADGNALKGLNNPYLQQTPEVELHIMANMHSTNQENISLMPKSHDGVIIPDGPGVYGKCDVIPEGVQQKADFQEGRFTLSVDNSKSNKDFRYYFRGGKGQKNIHWLTEAAGLPEKFKMLQSRGVSITVVGDGSGSMLVFSAGTGFPRPYGVRVDFVGTRTFEIPHGEAIINHAIWDTHGAGTITAHNYDMSQFSVYLNHVPAGKNAKIHVLDVQAMMEGHDRGLIDPILKLNGSKVTVTGSIPYNHYFVYKGGSEGKVYGPNWKFVRNLPAAAEGALIANHGDNTFSVNALKSPNTFLSSRLKVKDKENVITIDKPL